MLPDRRGREQRAEGLVNGYDIHLPFARETLSGTPEAERAWFARQAEGRADMALVELYAGAYAEARYMRRSAFACFLSGGRGDIGQADQIAEAWFETEEARTAAHGRAERIAKAFVRSPKGWAAIQAVAGVLLDRGRLNGDEVDALCAEAYGTPFRYAAWDGAWPPTPDQIRAGAIPEYKPKKAA